MARKITLIAAYGRHYPTATLARKAWEEGMDFKVLNGPYCSIRDIAHMVRLHETVEIQYGNGDFLLVWAYNKHRLI